jgi:hypothetical protein
LIQHCGNKISCAPFIQDLAAIEEFAWLLPETHMLFDALLDTLVARL